MKWTVINYPGLLSCFRLLKKAKNETAELEMVVCKCFLKPSSHLKADVWKILKKSSRKDLVDFRLPHNTTEWCL